MTEREMKNLFRVVSDDFEQTNGYSITDYALDELLRPAVPHLREVTESLKKREMTEIDLRFGIRKILVNALPFARAAGRQYISYSDIRESLAKECPYLFWC